MLLRPRQPDGRGMLSRAPGRAPNPRPGPWQAEEPSRAGPVWRARRAGLGVGGSTRGELARTDQHRAQPCGPRRADITNQVRPLGCRARLSPIPDTGCWEQVLGT